MKNDKLISLNMAIDALEGIDCSDGVGLSALKCDVVDDAVATIKALPIIDTVPVAHGQWIKVGYIEHTWLVSKCSVCSGQTIDAGMYCTNCGALMDGRNGERHD